MNRRERLAHARLYLIGDGPTIERVLEAALAGGVDVVQLRSRAPSHDDARATAARCHRAGALFIVNDDPVLAAEVDADGVHVGQDDASAEEARGLLGPDAIVGLSTHSEEQIAAANERPIDYMSVGPVWETPTKAGRPAVGLELVSHAAEQATRPFFGIGGIDPGNAEQVVRAGARRLCAVRAIRDAADPGAAAEALRGAFATAEGAGPSSQDALLDQPAPWRGVAPGG
jgi:thiamine-phosphate pyrophosphorylase